MWEHIYPLWGLETTASALVKILLSSGVQAQPCRSIQTLNWRRNISIRIEVSSSWFVLVFCLSGYFLESVLVDHLKYIRDFPHGGPSRFPFISIFSPPPSSHIQRHLRGYGVDQIKLKSYTTNPYFRDLMFSGFISAFVLVIQSNSL